MNITGIILAAGTSSRMGRNKLLLEYGGRTVIEETLSRMIESRVDKIIVVTGHERVRIDEVVSRYLSGRVTTAYNGNYAMGRAESIRCAIEAIDRHTDAALFMVADKPGVSTELINRAIDRFEETEPAILYVKTPAGRGHPIIFSKTIFDELTALTGDIIGEQLVENHIKGTVELIDETIQIDIDTEQDYMMLVKNRLSQDMGIQ